MFTRGYGSLWISITSTDDAQIPRLSFFQPHSSLEDLLQAVLRREAWRTTGIHGYGSYGMAVMAVMVQILQIWWRNPGLRINIWCRFQIPWKNPDIWKFSLCVHQFSGVFIVSFHVFFYRVHMFSQIFPASFSQLFFSSNHPIIQHGSLISAPCVLGSVRTRAGLGSWKMEKSDMQMSPRTEGKITSNQESIESIRQGECRSWIDSVKLDVHHDMSWTMLNH